MFNIGKRNGQWGEDVACRFLKGKGYSIIDRNVRPYAKDRRLEIDIVAFAAPTDTVVFVEVKQHAERTAYDMRLRSVDRRKKRLLLRACRAWLRANRWTGSHRFDVIEVYGSPDGLFPAEVDHVERVRLFAPADRHVNWA